MSKFALTKYTLFKYYLSKYALIKYLLTKYALTEQVRKDVYFDKVCTDRASYIANNNIYFEKVYSEHAHMVIIIRSVLHEKIDGHTRFAKTTNTL